MSRVLEIDSLDFDPDGLIRVTAVVDEVVLTHHATQWDPEEYGSALCRGSFYLSDEDLIPATGVFIGVPPPDVVGVVELPEPSFTDGVFPVLPSEFAIGVEVPPPSADGSASVILLWS